MKLQAIREKLDYIANPANRKFLIDFRLQQAEWLRNKYQQHIVMNNDIVRNTIAFKELILNYSNHFRKIIFIQSIRRFLLLKG